MVQLQVHERERVLHVLDPGRRSVKSFQFRVPLCDTHGKVGLRPRIGFQASDGDEQRLGTIEHLNLRLLIHAQHHRTGGQRQVQADDVALAIKRVLQCAATRGPRSGVRAITSSIFASLILRGWPGCGASSNPSSRCSTNLRRHLPTVCTVTRQRCATWRLLAGCRSRSFLGLKPDLASL